MERILKSYTIIPKELYIKRQADRQIELIINEMERPGYVLVSRQMGKTNLLLNTKRELENDENVFTYIDLSNTFPDPKSCFENIINTIIDTHPTLFVNCLNDLKLIREEPNQLPPNFQHLKELQLLLKNIKNKLVIILDEIDALTKIDYSDLIFSQIRSSYFQRSNYPELQKLTYILSGVAEPSEIIKNPKISPFNIGEEIFLNDFTLEEFNSFIEKANLGYLVPEIVNQIFFWTKGNPRITFDICSAVEKKYPDIYSEKDIDEIVKEIYLTRFDKPPIDNIRDLIKNDRQLRDSVLEIIYNKSIHISDSIKKKLYLAGVINYEKDKKVELKNNIIKETLSEEWLRTIDEEIEVSYISALEYYHLGKYEKCIESFNNYLKKAVTIDNEHENIIHYHLGLSHYFLADYNSAINYLGKVNFTKEKTGLRLYTTLRFYLAQSFLHEDKLAEAASIYKEIISNKERDAFYVNSILNLGAITITDDKHYDLNELILEYREIITHDFSDFDLSGISEDFQDIRAHFYINLSLLLKKSKSADLDEIQSLLIKALESNEEIIKPYVYLDLIESFTDNESKEIYFNKLLDFLRESEIKLQSWSILSPLRFNKIQLNRMLYESFDFDKTKTFERFLNYAKSVLQTESKAQILYDIIQTTIDYNKYEIATKILDELETYIENNEFDLDKNKEIDVYKFNVFFKRDKSNLDGYIHYFNLINSNREKGIDFIDIENFVYGTYFLINERKYLVADKFLDIIMSFENSIDEKLRVNFILFKNYKLIIAASIGKQQNIIQNLAKELLSDIEKHKESKRDGGNLLGEKEIMNIQTRAEGYLNFKSTAPFVKGKTYERNDKLLVRFNNGDTKIVKYKHYEEDINKGICKVIEKVK